MLRITSQKLAQYGDIDKTVERSREKYVEDTYQQRYEQGTEEYQVWGLNRDGKRYLALDESFRSPEEARNNVLQNVDNFVEQGFVELWVAQDGEYVIGIWEADEGI